MTFVPFSKEKYDFNQAGLYRKSATLDRSNVTTAVGGEAIVTYINGQEETKNIAAEGDKIVTGSQGEQYIIRADKFPNLYEVDPNNPDLFVSKGIRKVLFLSEDTVINASWGEQQFIKAGGVVVESGDHVYGIEEQAFKDTYARVDNDGNIIVAMNESLSAQREAIANHPHILDGHKNDIQSRLIFMHGDNDLNLGGSVSNPSQKIDTPKP